MIYQSAFFAKAVLATTIDVGDTCYTDSSCESYCCDNDGNYHVSGECVPLDESDRCSKRKLQYNIALWLIILAMVIGSAVFGW